MELVFLQECKTERKTDKSDEATYIERLESFIAFKCNRLFWNEIYLIRQFATPLQICMFLRQCVVSGLFLQNFVDN